MQSKVKALFNGLRKFNTKYFNSDASKHSSNSFIIIFLSILSISGLIILLSASSYLTIKYESSRFFYVIRQAVFTIIGFIVMIIFSKIDYNFYKKYGGMFYIISIILLILCYVPFISSPINGAKRAIKIFITFMPSDVAKLFVLIALSKLLITNYKENDEWKNGFFKIMIFIFIPFILIFFQTDLSTSLVLLFACLSVYFIYGFNKKFLLVLIPGILVSVLSLKFILKPYQIDRLIAFLNPEAYYDDISWQVLNGLFGFSRGGVFGVGFGKGIYKHGYLSNEVINDMIFSVVGEEFGFIGAIAILLLVFIITYLVIREAMKSKDIYAKLLCFGIGMVYFFQSMINIGVTISLVPNTGITLPFISNGGTSLIAFFAMFGVVLNISRQNKYLEKNENNKNKKNV
ncbi:FtsW/RodA/SpoVE family cell cycle protein [Helcococcus ovis]|uniref:FtsW/RodA/SpoVE family cell cycle protein n=2 Tax=Helcococcus ovis TaxID=72026 RepID=UPI00106F4C60|nr:FtsW/RodA/SpoVE family cell cycle protein [Helcococcus ovis]TFF66939.1 FtsW/RodA/SpoVE family cell cycle protein [Helcococcus ovis]WNZ01853.1 FtsW/RodA/SpoVE family cell cycle protein [Helcococcus ovis]